MGKQDNAVFCKDTYLPIKFNVYIHLSVLNNPLSPAKKIFSKCVLSVQLVISYLKLIFCLRLQGIHPFRILSF
jgi:hypothetical protein